MKDTEAREIVTMIKAATNTPRLDENTSLFWEEMLRHLDADLASKTMLSGIRAWTHFPAWADFKQSYDVFRRLTQPDAHYAAPIKVSRSIPEWVYVWRWSRIVKQDWRSFPQQEDYGDPFNYMTTDDYEQLHGEWKAAGAPRSNPLEGVLA